MRTLTLVPWDQDFIAALGRELVEREDFSDLTVVFPHNRPRRYLKRFFQECPSLPRPVFLPHMTSIADFVVSLRRDLAPAPVTSANQLDLVELLRVIVTDVRREGRGLLARLPELDREAFLPWGVSLAGLMDDLMRHNIEPADLAYMQGEVSPFASGLLEQLSVIHAEYVARLFQRSWTTPGLDWRFLVTNIAQVADALSGQTVVAAGFYALSGAEDLLFRRLWEDGVLHPFIHSDRALAEGGKPHWATAEHRAWLARWGCVATLSPHCESTTGAPSIRFCEGFDRHSQLAALADDLDDAPSFDDTAVVLPDEGALLPVLHHLPVAEPNISMGYPLGRTSLARFIETILTLHENRLDDGRCRWRDLVNLLRHPYLRLLGPDDAPLRPVLQAWEADLRQGERLVDAFAWRPPYGDRSLGDVDETAAEPLRQTILNRCLTGFGDIETFSQLADGLAGLASLLHEQGERLWHRYLIDAECLFRLTTSIVPQLKGAEVSHAVFSRSTLHAHLRRLLRQERVSFEPEPLAGLQTMGVLETRLLHFKRLHILDAVEERLPDANPYDPLLPDPLRKLLGLPDARERDNVSGYNFYRLLMGAQEAVIYYQNGVQPGLLDAKSVRSRFVEQLLWERETATGRLVEPGDDVVRTVTFPVGPLHAEAVAVPKTQAIQTLLEEKLQNKGLSPSSLDRYLQCPKQFYYAYLTRVRPVDEVNEDGDRAAFGSLIHETLREFFQPHVGRKTHLGELNPQELVRVFTARFESDAHCASLPFDTRMALAKAARHQLTALLVGQKETTLLALEQSLATKFNVEGTSVPFAGKLDRLERTAKGVVVSDYKTGGGRVPQKDFWQDVDLHERMAASPESDVHLLTDLEQAVRSIQLPAYLHLHRANDGDVPHNAGLVKLAERGAVDWLFGAKWTDDERREAVDETVPLLLNALIRHMLLVDRFAPQPGRRCDFCDYRAPCGQ